MEETVCKHPRPGVIRQRYVLAVMAFSAIFHVFVLRANMSVAIVAMVGEDAMTNAKNATISKVCTLFEYYQRYKA